MPVNIATDRVRNYAGTVMNYWFWLYIFLTPVLVFLVKPDASVWLRIFKIIFSIGVCYILINLAVHLKWDFIHKEIRSIPNPTENDLERAANDGANLAFSLIFGWIPATVYVGWWELLWRFLYRKRQKTSKDKARLLSSIVIIFSLLISLVVFLFFAIPNGFPRGLYIFLQILLPPFLDTTGISSMHFYLHLHQ